MQKALPPNHKQITDKCSGRKKVTRVPAGHTGPTDDLQESCLFLRKDPKDRKGASLSAGPSGLRTPELPPSSHEKAFHTFPTASQPPSETEKPVSTHPSNAVPFCLPRFSPASKPWVHFLPRFTSFKQHSSSLLLVYIINSFIIRWDSVNISPSSQLL